MKSIYTNEKGFSIAGVMVAAAILGIISLAALTVIGDIVAAGGKAKFDNDIVNDLDLLRMNLKKSNFCTLNLKDVKIANSWQTVDESKINFRLPLASNPSVLGTEPLLGTDSILKQVELRFEAGSRDIVRARLRFDSKSKIMGSQSTYRDMILAVSVDDTTDQLQSCSLEENNNDDAHKAQGQGCNRLPATAGFGGGVLGSGGYGAQPQVDIMNLEALCSGKTYPMSGYFTENQLHSAVNASARQRGLTSTNLKFNQFVQRGKYKSKQECKEQYALSEGDRVVITSSSGGNSSTQIQICVNGLLVETGGYQTFSGGGGNDPGNMPNGSAHSNI